MILLYQLVIIKDRCISQSPLGPQTGYRVTTIGTSSSAKSTFKVGDQLKKAQKRANGATRLVC